MSRLAVALVMVAGLVSACQAGASSTPSPVPTSSPHTPVAQAVLQQANVPAGLAACASSGAMAAYISALSSANPELGRSVSTDWSHLKAHGATAAQIALFAADPAACSAELAASGSIKAAASIVVAFGDEGQAERAWQQGIFGLSPPAPGEAPAGIVRGASTGLGASSWTYDRGPVRLASWRKSVFVALVVFSNLDPASFKAATAAVDAHLN